MADLRTLLTRRIGPLPAWGWGVAGLGGVGLAFLLRRRGAGSAVTTPEAPDEPILPIDLEPGPGQEIIIPEPFEVPVLFEVLVPGETIFIEVPIEGPIPGDDPVTPAPPPPEPFIPAPTPTPQPIGGGHGHVLISHHHHPHGLFHSDDANVSHATSPAHPNHHHWWGAGVPASTHHPHLHGPPGHS